MNLPGSSKCNFARHVVAGCVALSAAVFPGCATDKDIAGGETNFFRTCQDDNGCTFGACYCGICTAPCAGPTDCAEADSAVCGAQDLVAEEAICGAQPAVADHICLPLNGLADRTPTDPPSAGLGESVSLKLQPGPEGKDAELGSHPDWATLPLPDRPTLLVAGWTRNGEPHVLRSLLEFDDSHLPPDAVLESAKLSLFAEPTLDSYGRGLGHAQDESSNAFFIKRVVEPWDEETVTWETLPATAAQKQVSAPASTTALENYLEIDVTALMEEMRSSAEGNHGFMIELQSEDPYRGLSFASSDHPDAALHPILELQFRPKLP
jgi:hypothetical protein